MKGLTGAGDDTAGVRVDDVGFGLGAKGGRTTGAGTKVLVLGSGVATETAYLGLSYTNVTPAVSPLFMSSAVSG